MSAARDSCVTDEHTRILSSVPSFPSARLWSTADRVVISPSSAAAFHSLYGSLLVKGARSSSVRSSGLSGSTTGRDLGEGTSLQCPGEKVQPTAAQSCFALPFSPNVPEMDGCSPVNFLGVFCFLPDSKERNRERDLVK